MADGLTEEIDSTIMQPNPVPKIIVLPNRAALAQDAAQRFISLAARAIAERGRFSAALSGGSTPRDLFAMLATPEMAARIDWPRVHLFWGDERGVPPDDPASNYRMTESTLLSHVPIPAQNVHRIPTEKEANTAAREYEETLRAFFAGERSDAWPRFDLVLLGLGENGHTASLFPHAALLHEATRWVAAEYIGEVGMDRVTLTAPVINNARQVIFLVAGADKAQTVAAVIHGEYHPEELPAQLIRPIEGDLIWLLDSEAAGAL